MHTYMAVLSSDSYLPGALALNRSIRVTGARHELAILLTRHVSPDCEVVLKKHKLNVKRLPRELILEEQYRGRNVRRGFSHWNRNLNKLLIFEQTEYRKIVFLDLDLMILQNIDALFHKPHMSAVSAGILIPGNESWTSFNSGLMRKPSRSFTSGGGINPG